MPAKKLKTFVKVVLVVLFVATVVLQFFQIDKAAPATDPAQALESSTSVPGDIDLILTTSCNDCHTNKTVYPWYAYIQPSGWLLNSHILDGRRHLNFSIWNTYDRNKKQKKMEQICDEVTEGAMPLPSYLWIHRNAVLDQSQVKALCDWSNAEAKRIEEQGSSGE